MMHPTLHRLFACILLFSLSMQTVQAGTAIACPIATTSQMATHFVMDDCVDPSRMDSSMVAMFEQEQPPDPEHRVHDSSLACGMSGNCLALAGIAILPPVKESQIDPGFHFIGFVDTFYRSYISEGLQRPP